MGKLAGVDGVSGRRAVLQLLLPAARLHADDCGPAELGRARRVSRHRRHGRPAVGLAKRRAAEAEAVRTEARLASVHNRSLLEASLDALVTIGSDGKINDVNSAIETLTGRSRAALIGTDFSDCFTEPEKARRPIGRSSAKASCAIVRWSFATGTGT